MEAENTPLKRTPLWETHRAAGARLVPFAGWDMPVQYAGVVQEHNATRNAAGLFDVSHMGELRLRGPGAEAVVASLVTNDVARLAVGHSVYTAACNERGTILDDLIIYRVDAGDVLVVCNASNRAKMSPHFAAHARGKCDFEDQSDTTALIALQGPKAPEVLKAAGGSGLVELGRKCVGTGTVAGLAVIAARTGYTGEDGFELFCAPDHAAKVWGALMEAGRAFGIAPVGLGARDTLRLEAALRLYGNDIDETTDPFEAGIGWVVKLDSGTAFLGRDALVQKKAQGPSRKLVGLEMTGRGIARHGYPIVDAAGAKIGDVTSGSPGPTVGKNIGLGYVPVAHSAVGTKLAVEIRGKAIDAVVVALPFYKRV